MTIAATDQGLARDLVLRNFKARHRLFPFKRVILHQAPHLLLFVDSLHYALGFTLLYELLYPRSSMDLFRVRLNCVDHYQATPTEFDPQLPRTRESSQQKTIPRVPVIRVFGATETGQKVCAHIHGAFPYLYIEYNGSLIPEDGRPHL